MKWRYWQASGPAQEIADGAFRGAEIAVAAEAQWRPNGLWLSPGPIDPSRQTRANRTSGADLTFAILGAATHKANVNPKLSSFFVWKWHHALLIAAVAA
jgi:hypothetical protein